MNPNLSNATPGSGGKEYFTVKAANPGSTSKILLLDNLTTVQAYGSIGGKSFYGFNSTNDTAAVKVSVDRPTGVGDWPEYVAFAKWLDKQGIAYESASMMDLHNDPNLLKNYNLVVTQGHNEYWSQEMRNNWDNYLASGGNAAIFGGNTMWWRVRFENNNKTMVCYKTASDPGSPTTTGNWYSPTINKPENLSTGVSFRHGGYANYTDTQTGANYYVKGVSGNGTDGGFQVVDASNWAFSGTGLGNGSNFGTGTNGVHPIAGYEVDGALFKMVNGKPVVTGEDQTPTNFQILALTPAYAVNSPSNIQGGSICVSGSCSPHHCKHQALR
jgi:hypothetical protein